MPESDLKCEEQQIYDPAEGD